MSIKNIIKPPILLILHLIRKIITVLKNHCLPLPPKIYKTYSRFEEEQFEKSYSYFKPYFEKAIFLETHRIREYAIKESIKNDKYLENHYLEFGIFVGTSINFFSKYVKKIYGFDSFEGLKEDWVGFVQPAGTFNLNKKIPKLNSNVVPIVGWVQDTLDNFLKKEKPRINFVHLDMDTYETTKFILEKIKPYLINDSIIIFDELYNYPGWQFGEFKALKEIFNESEYQYIAFSKEGSEAVIKFL